MHASVYPAEEHMYKIHNSCVFINWNCYFYLIEKSGSISVGGTSVVVFVYFCFTRGSESN